MFSQRLNSNMTTLRNSNLNSFRFSATAPLTQLSKVFQTENLSFTSIKPAIARTKCTLQGIDVTSMNNSADWQHDFELYIEANELPDGDATDIYQTCAKPFIEALLSNLDERFPEDAIAVLDAADIFDPINIASCTSPESRYMYGRSEVLTLAEHFGLETTTVLTKWLILPCHNLLMLNRL